MCDHDPDDLLPDEEVCEKETLSSKWSFVIGLGLIILLIFLISP